LRYRAARVNEKGCLPSSGPGGYKEIFDSSSYPHFCPFGKQDLTKDNQPTYIMGNPSLPFLQ
jgi:hypothetical protein